jgi:hypothetical protein
MTFSLKISTTSANKSILSDGTQLEVIDSFPRILQVLNTCRREVPFTAPGTSFKPNNVIEEVVHQIVHEHGAQAAVTQMSFELVGYCEIHSSSVSTTTVSPSGNNSSSNSSNNTDNAMLTDFFQGLGANLSFLFTSFEEEETRNQISWEEIKNALGSYRRLKPTDPLIGSDNNCLICLKTFQENQGVRNLSCEHVFHKKCVDQWFRSGHQTCPTCRKNCFT